MQTSQNPAKVLRVQAIALSVVVVKRTTTVDARVTITDVNGVPVSGVTITGAWSGGATGTATGTTDASGVALIKSKALRKSGTVTFTVSGASKTSFVYDASKNVVSSASIAAA